MPAATILQRYCGPSPSPRRSTVMGVSYTASSRANPYLNWDYGTSRMAQIISSMLGVYTLQFLDYDTYRRDKGLLEKDPDYPLRDYASRDAQSRAPADPCNPTQQANSFRYPTADWFKRAALEHTRGIYRQVAAPLTDPGVRQKFHNFRGVRYRNGTLIKDTVNSQTWGWVQRDFDPDAVDRRLPTIPVDRVTTPSLLGPPGLPVRLRTTSGH